MSGRVAAERQKKRLLLDGSRARRLDGREFGRPAGGHRRAAAALAVATGPASSWWPGGSSAPRSRPAAPRTCSLAPTIPRLAHASTQSTWYLWVSGLGADGRKEGAVHTNGRPARESGGMGACNRRAEENQGRQGAGASEFWVMAACKARNRPVKHETAITFFFCYFPSRLPILQSTRLAPSHLIICPCPRSRVRPSAAIVQRKIFKNLSCCWGMCD